MSIARIAQSIAAVIVVVLLLWGVMQVLNRCAPEPAEPTSDHFTDVGNMVVTPITVTAPAVITHESVTPDSVLHEIATLDTLITTERTAVDLRVRYDEADNLFNIKAQILEQPIPQPKPVRLAIEIDSGWTGKDGWNPDVVGVGVGVEVKERYRILGFVNTKKTFGLRLGVNL